MADFPANVRIALKDGDLHIHILLPGELAQPFKRSGYEVREYTPVAALPTTLKEESGHIAEATMAGTFPIARCSCGWESDILRSSRAAQTAADNHMASASTTPKGGQDGE
jgi:hypothetical protein